MISWLDQGEQFASPWRLLGGSTVTYVQPPSLIVAEDVLALREVASQLDGKYAAPIASVTESEERPAVMIVAGARPISGGRLNFPIATAGAGAARSCRF